MKVRFENDKIACLSQMCTEECPNFNICEEVSILDLHTKTIGTGLLFVNDERIRGLQHVILESRTRTDIDNPKVKLIVNGNEIKL